MSSNLNSDGIKSWPLAIFLFCISLESYYFYEMGVAPIPYLALLFVPLLLLNGNSRINKKIFILIILFSGICAISFLNNFSQSDQSIKTISGIFLSLMSGFVVYGVANKDTVASGLGYFLSIHALVFFIQVVLMVFGVNIDLIEPITGEVQRVGTSTYEIFGRQIFRPTGLFTEPGTFSAHYLPVLLLWLMVVNNLNLKKWILIVAPVFSLSTLAIILWVAFVPLVLILRRLININLLFMLTFGVLAITFSYLFFDYFMYSLMIKISIEDLGGNEVRLLFLKEQIYENIGNILFSGNGYPISPPSAVNGEEYLLRDQGVFIWMVWTLGVLPSLILVGACAAFVGSRIYFIPLIVLLMSKNPMSYPFSIFLIYLIIWCSEDSVCKKCL